MWHFPLRCCVTHKADIHLHESGQQRQRGGGRGGARCPGSNRGNKEGEWQNVPTMDNAGAMQ